MVKFIRSDLDFILEQIFIAEQNAAGMSMLDLLPNVQVPFGLRTVTGVNNNLVLNQDQFGAANNTFPRLLPPVFQTADVKPAGFFGPGDPAGTTPTSYTQTSGFVFDSDPRTISNLIVDQTANNPAAVAAAAATPGSTIAMSPGLDGVFGTADDKPVEFIPNVKPDFGLTVPFNAWMTFFGQFFDHGLDLVTKGNGSGTIFIPLKPDDPLYVVGSPTNFMVLTRATNLPGPDGIVGTADDIHEQENTTSPFVDQNQTYSSHPSHQVFLRAYRLDANGHPVATGKLITNRDLGADGKFGTADDHEIGGMATWQVVKAQARDILGINLTDANVFDVPLLATDDYGNFIKGAHGMPLVMMKGADGLADTTDDVLVEGNRAAPISLANAVATGHQFLIDIAHSADPSGGLVADGNNIIGGVQPAGTYDDELLNVHYIAGDGRVNENIGLTAVHSIFHSEHNRLVDQTMQVALQSNDLSFLTQWLMPGTAPASLPHHPGGDRRAAVERRAAVPGRQVRHRDAIPAPRVRGVRSHGPASDRRIPRALRLRYPDRSVDRRGVRPHGLSLRTFDADRDGGPLRPQLQRRGRLESVLGRQSADGPDRRLPEPARLRRQRPDAVAGVRRHRPRLDPHCRQRAR